MHVLIKQLVERSAWLADSFSWDDITVGDGGRNDAEIHMTRIETIERILSEMKTLLTDNFEIK